MCTRNFQKLVIAVLLAVSGTAIGYAQGVFSVGSSQPIVADIGLAEVSGPLSFVVVSGTTVQAPLEIQYSAPITNNDASEILVTGTGTLAGSTVSIDRIKNSIIVNVAAGSGTGDRLTIFNVRLAISGLATPEATATIFSPTATGNQLIAGQTVLPVIGAISEPFSIDQTVWDPLTYTDGKVTQAQTYFDISESYANALVASPAGVGRIRINPFPTIPAGLTITYGAQALSVTGAVFTTLSGNPETVPRADGSTDVVYQLTGGPGSESLVEAFGFSATMGGETSGSGMIQFQATLLPIGLAVPTIEYPSTEIPRYIERQIPDEIDLVSGRTDLLFSFPIKNADNYTGIALTNPLNYRVRATLTAYDNDGNVIGGTDIANPVTVDLPRRGQYAKLASEVFGESFNVLSGGTIRVVGRTNTLEGFYMTGDGPKLDGAIGNMAGTIGWYLPVVFHQGVTPFNTLEFYNPGDTDVTLNLKLMNSDGTQVATATKTLGAATSFSGDVTEVFGGALSSFTGGYIKGDSDAALIVKGTFGNEMESNVLQAIPANSLVSYSVPHFASGAPYTTELTIVNTNPSVAADLTITLLNDSGMPMVDPVAAQISPGKQWVKTIADLFPNLGSDLKTGSIRIDVTPYRRGPFSTVPALTGAVRFANVDGSASATIPLVLATSKDFIYSHIAQSADWFTGVAVLNSNSTAVSMTLDVYQKDGTKTGTYSAQLQPNQRFSQLIYELVPASAGQSGGYIRISSSANLSSVSFFGSGDGRSLSLIPPQDVP